MVTPEAPSESLTHETSLAAPLLGDARQHGPLDAEQLPRIHARKGPFAVDIHEDVAHADARLPRG